MDRASIIALGYIFPNLFRTPWLCCRTSFLLPPFVICQYQITVSYALAILDFGAEPKCAITREVEGLRCLFGIVMYCLNRRKLLILCASSERKANEIRRNTKPYPVNMETFCPCVLTNYRLFDPLRSMPPTTPAAIATPLNIATPINPSLATLSSIRPLRLSACRFAGS